MFKTFVTPARISGGFKGEPAIRFSDNKNAANFRVGYRVYDKNAKDNHRYINLTVKAFGSVCERIEKMQLKQGSNVTILGRIDEEKWTDKESGQECSRIIIIADEVEFTSYDGAKTNGNGNGNGGANANGTGSASNAGTAAPPPANPPEAPAQPQNAQGSQTEMPSGFTGYENIDDGNPFFPGN